MISDQGDDARRLDLAGAPSQETVETARVRYARGSLRGLSHTFRVFWLAEDAPKRLLPLRQKVTPWPPYGAG